MDEGETKLTLQGTGFIKQENHNSDYVTGGDEDKDIK